MQDFNFLFSLIGNYYLNYFFCKELDLMTI